jgi:hypothetical protein
LSEVFIRVSQIHLEKLRTERDYFLAQVNDEKLPDDHRQGCEEMVKFYDYVILAAQRYIKKVPN